MTKAAALHDSSNDSDSDSNSRLRQWRGPFESNLLHCVKRVVIRYRVTVSMETLYVILGITSPYSPLYICYTLLINVIHSI